MNGYYIAAALVAPAAMIGEHTLARRAKLAAYRFEDTVTNVASFAGELVLTAVLQLNVFAAYAWLWDRVAFVRLDASSWVVWLLAFLTLDLVYYAGHRVCHRVAAMWALHAVHHQSGEYNLGVGMRGPWLSALQIAPFILPVALLGFPPSVLFPIYAMQTVYKLAVHTRLVGRLGALEGVLVTPSSHRVHHASQRAYRDKNFGGVLAIWDRLFGTHAEEVAPAMFAPGAPCAGFDTIENNLGPWRAIAERAGEVGLARALFGRPAALVPRPLPRGAAANTRAKWAAAFGATLASGIAIGLLARDDLGPATRLCGALAAFTILALVGRVLQPSAQRA
jgi:sterol desaturase/sphingolipid hydroxylase (fatty acid hydroxylase superfamily)